MIKVTIKLDKRRKLKNGKYPLKFKIARKDKAIYIPSGYELNDVDWDTKNEKVKNLADRRNVNIKLCKRLSDINEKITNLQKEGKLRFLSNKKLKSYILNEDDEDKCNMHLFKTLMYEYVNSKDKNGTKIIYHSTETRIKEFCDYENLRVEDIDVSWLDSFVSFLKKENTPNTIALRLKNIRTILNYARRKGVLKEYVFNFYTIKNQETQKRALSIDELRKLYDAELSETRAKYRDLFFLIFFLMGINMVDLASIEKINNGRINYRRAKTGTIYNIKVEPEALKIIEKYKGEKKLINIFDDETNYKIVTKNTNFSLKRICENLNLPEITVYWARHSFATIAYEAGISIDVIADCLGHKGDHRITQVYIKKDQKKIDEANRKVIDYFLHNKKELKK